MDGDEINNVYWGDTPEEVYRQCKSLIDSLWKDEYEKYGFNKLTMFVKSATFIKGSMKKTLL